MISFFENKRLKRLVLLFLRNLQLQSKTILKKSIKQMFKYYKLQFVFETQNKLSIDFCLNDSIPQVFSVHYVTNPLTKNMLDILF